MKGPDVLNRASTLRREGVRTVALRREDAPVSAREAGTQDDPIRDGARDAGTRSVWRGGLAVFVAALAIRLVFALPLWQFVHPYFDLSRGSDGYERVARTVAAGRGYRYAPHLCETMILLPTYPLFLAGVITVVDGTRDTQIIATRVVQSFMDALTALMIAMLARRWYGDRVGLLAGLCYALYPGMWVACARYVTEPLFNFLTTAFVLAFVRWMDRGQGGWLGLAALACALAAMCKSVAPPLPLALLFAVLVVPLWRRQWRRVFGGLVACCLLTGAASAAWLLRNHAVSGEWVFPSTLSGQALYTAHLYVAHPHQTLRETVDQSGREMHRIAAENGIHLDPKDRYPRWFRRSADEVKLDRLLREIASERIASDSGRFAVHIAANVWRFWFGAPTPSSVAAAIALNGPLLALAVAGLLLVRWWRAPGLALWLAMSAYLVVSHVGVLAVVRYSQTVVPVMCVFAAVTLARLLWRRPILEGEALVAPAAEDVNGVTR